ncbi:MAG: HTH-type transcriptional activator RhaS [Phycisphaerae bacterium]|nr:HTH-type transcriptional activator RhaS [Phycisphaerae bacterium]
MAETEDPSSTAADRPGDGGPASPIDAEAFRRIASAYRRRWGVRLCAAWPDGRVAMGVATAARGQHEAATRAREHAIAEALRWGEPTVVEYPGKRLAWAAPLMHNRRLLGGLIAVTAERRALPGSGGPAPIDTRQACADLRTSAEEMNLTNADLLAARRAEYDREQKRAEAIQDLKTRYFYSIREVYLREEPALVAAVRRGDRHEARGILNRILVEIYHLGGDDLKVIKSFLMELVVTMCRTAVECGGDPQQLLGANFASISELSGIDSEVDLSHWLVQMLERIMDSIRRHRREPSAAMLHAAMKYLAAHFQDPVSRDQVARMAGLSPAYFSRLIHQRMGRSFSDLVNQMRADRAAELLRDTDKSVLAIALEVGFNDQSYFTKVFRRYRRMTPRQYRRREGS